MGDHQTWAGYLAGLGIPDQLILLDGQPLESSTALMRALSLYEPGDVITLTAQGEDGALRDVKVRLEPFPVEALIGFFVLPYVVGWIYLGVGTWVFRARRYELAQPPLLRRRLARHAMDDPPRREFGRARHRRVWRRVFRLGLGSLLGKRARDRLGHARADK